MASSANEQELRGGCVDLMKSDAPKDQLTDQKRLPQLRMQLTLLFLYNDKLTSPGTRSHCCIEAHDVWLQLALLHPSLVNIYTH